MKTETAPNISGLKSLGNGTDTRTTNTVTIQVENNRLDWFKASGTGWFSQTKPQIVLYNNEAAFGDGMVNKSSYCLYSSKHSPEGNYHPGGGQFLSAAINYVLYYGNRAYGETMHDPKYSAGEYYKDYYITSMAIHYLNGEMGNEPMFQITDEHISSLGDPVAADMYQKYKLLIADAKKQRQTVMMSWIRQAAYRMPNIVSREIPPRMRGRWIPKMEDTGQKITIK